MNKYLYLIFLALLISCLKPGLAVQQESPVQLDEEKFIVRAVEDMYIKGLEDRNFELIKTVCIPECVLMSSRKDGTLSLTTLEIWSKRFDPRNPPFKHLYSCILKIDQEGTAAQVKILFIVDSEIRVTDYLHMLKLDGQWRIVNIIDY